MPVASTLLLAMTAHTVPFINMRVGTQPTPSAVSPGFVGLSIETYHVVGMLAGQRGVQLRNALANMYDLTPRNNPGPVIRVGGDSSDTSCFIGSDGNMPVQGCTCDYNITISDLQLYRNFSTKFSAQNGHVKFVLGTNLACGKPEMGAAHIRAISNQKLWDVVSAIELGNEVDKFPSKYRQSNWNVTDYEREFMDHVSHFRKYAALPAKRMQGATFCTLNASWDNGLLGYSNRNFANLASISYHAYSLHGGSKPILPPDFPLPSNATNSTYHTRALLSQSATDGLSSKYISVVHDISPLELVIGEGNSESGGGWAGTSDVFPAALWAIDWLADISKRGAVRQNIHGGPTDKYAPLVFDDTGVMHVRPLYYGMLVFSELVANRTQWLPTTLSTPPNGSVIAHAGKDENGFVRIVLLSKDLESQTSERVRISIPISLVPSCRGNKTAKASAAWLLPPSNQDPKVAKVGITWAGQTFDGTRTGRPKGSRRTTNEIGIVLDEDIIFDIDLPVLTCVLLNMIPCGL